MTEEQKKIIENIHAYTEDLMLEKANLTLIARQNALTGKPDNEIIEQLRQADEQILKYYKEAVNNLKKYAKDLKTLAQKEYGNGIVSQDKQFISFGNELQFSQEH